MRLPIIGNLPRPPRSPVPEPKNLALYWLFGSTLFVLLPHLPRLPVWIAATTVALILWRLVCLNRDIKPPGWLINVILALLLIGLVLAQYQTIFGRTAGSALLVVFAALKVLETTTLRDAMFNAILLMVLVMTEFLFDQSPGTALYGLAGILLIVGNLNMLVAPSQFDLRNAIRFTLKILMHGIPLALVAYLLFPRIEGSLWGFAEDSRTGVTGLTDTISPGSLSNLISNKEVAFRVEFDSIQPEAEDLYFRTLVLELTNGKTWQRAPKAPPPSPVNPTEDSQILAYEITLEPSGKPWLPMLETPYNSSRNERINGLGVLSASRPIQDRVRYRGTSFTRGVISEAQPSEFNTRLYPQVSDRVTELARQLRDGNTSDLDLAHAALDYFKENEFTYTLSPPLLGDRPVDEFLFDTREGFCEHFASAFTVLMRAAGIPSRVVLGYQGSDYNEDQDYHIVRQSNAHAWSEVWLAEHGWVRADPTATIAPERIEFGMSLFLNQLDSADDDFADSDSGSEDFRNSFGYRFRLAMDGMSHRWNQWILSYGPEQQRALLKRMGFKAPDWSWMLFSLFLISSIFLLITFLVMNRPGRLPESPLKYFRLFKQRLRSSGLEVQPWDGPLAICQQAAENLPVNRDQITSIGELYAALTYGKHDSAEGLSKLKQMVESFKPEKKAD